MLRFFFNFTLFFHGNLNALKQAILVQGFEEQYVSRYVDIISSSSPVHLSHDCRSRATAPSTRDAPARRARRLPRGMHHAWQSVVTFPFVLPVSLQFIIFSFFPFAHIGISRRKSRCLASTISSYRRTGCFKATCRTPTGTWNSVQPFPTYAMPNLNITIIIPTSHHRPLGAWQTAAHAFG